MYKKYFKRLIDLFLSIIGLLVSLVPFIIIIIALKIDSKGPVFFKQKRLGEHGNEFEILKFRTMVIGAEKMGDGLAIKSESDNRITKVGRFLRKTSLDELPQFINIVRGDMSLIGPRPPVTYHPYKGYNQYPEYAKKRFEAKPGITGLAQVVYRNSATWEERFVYDIKYVENITFMNDLKLIFQTLYSLIKKEDVYRKPGNEDGLYKMPPKDEKQ